MNLYTHRIAHPLVSAAIAVHTGWRHEPPHLRGLCHFLEHAHYLGSLHYPDIDGETARLGVQIDGPTLAEDTIFAFTALREDFEPLLSVLIDMVFHPRMEAAAIERERRDIIATVASPADYTAWEWVRLKVDDMIFQTDELHSLGERATVERIRRQDLLAWQARYYHPGNAHLIVVGDIDEAAIRARIEALDHLPGGEHPFPVEHRHDRQSFYEKRTNIQPEMYIGFRFPPEEDPLLLELLSIVFGNYGNSLLYKALERDEMLAYMVESKVRFLSDAGRFGIYVGVIGAGQERAAWDALVELLRRVREAGIPEQELAWAKRVFRFRLLKQAYDPERAMWFLTKWGPWQESFPGFAALEQRVQRVTAEHLRQLSRRLFRAENCFIAVVGPMRPPHLERWREALADTQGHEGG